MSYRRGRAPEQVAANKEDNKRLIDDGCSKSCTNGWPDYRY